jgi:hypothetical protein
MSQYSLTPRTPNMINHFSSLNVFYNVKVNIQIVFQSYFSSTAMPLFLTCSYAYSISQCECDFFVSFCEKEFFCHKQESIYWVFIFSPLGHAIILLFSQAVYWGKIFFPSVSMFSPCVNVFPCWPCCLVFTLPSFLDSFLDMSLRRNNIIFPPLAQFFSYL